MIQNGSTNVAMAGLLWVQQTDPRPVLDAYDDAISAMNTAYADAAAARAALDEEALPMERIEARLMVSIEGGNAETRKARLTLALAEDSRFQAHLVAHRSARERLADAERRISVQRERCRLFRSMIGLLDRTEPSMN